MSYVSHPPRYNRVSRHVVIASVLAGACVSASYPAPVLSKEQESATSGQRRFDIRSGNLTSALRQFAETTGLQLVYEAELAAGVRISGVSGSLTEDQALVRLLQGTGLMYRFTGARTVTIERAPASNGARTLGPVRVEGAGDNARVSGINGSRDVTATEGTKSFTTEAMTIGSKSPQSIKDTPQSISVLTSERMKQQNVTDFATAMKQLPGITSVQGNISLENTFYSRGFAVTSIQVDGGAPLQTFTKQLGNTGLFPLIDMSIYDHVELLRGAAGYNGYGEPGGTVNLVRKKPLDHAQVTLESQAGSWSNYRVSVDATSPLALDDKLRGRVVMTYQDNDYFYDTAKDNKTLIYGIAELDVTATTLLNAGISYTSQQSVPWRSGLPRYIDGSDLKLPRSVCLCFSWNRWDAETTEIFGNIEQKIGADWTAKLNLTQTRQTSHQKMGQSNGSVNNREDAAVRNAGPRMTGYFNDYGSKQLSGEVTLAGAFDIFGQHQEITLGANRVNVNGIETATYTDPTSGTAAAPYRPYPGGPAYYQGSPNGASPPINVFAFDPNSLIYSQPGDPLLFSNYPDWDQVQETAYVSLRLTAFDRLHLLTAPRWGRYSYRTFGPHYCTSIPTTGTPDINNCVGRQIGDFYQGATPRYYSDTQVSWPPPVTLTFDIDPSLNIYVGYTDIYQSQGDKVDDDFNPIDPITGENWEVGLKWQVRDGRLNLSASAFSISQEGFAVLDGVRDNNVTAEDRANGISYYFVSRNGRRVPNGRPDDQHGCCYKQDPNQAYTSKGFDLDVTGEVSTGWQIAASYTYDRTRQEGSSLGAKDGLPYTSIQPEHNYKLWTSYDFGAAGVSNWLSDLTVSFGLNGQSSGFKSGSACPSEWIVTDPISGAGVCASGRTVPFSFTVEPYTLFSARVDYRLVNNWALAVNVENLLDKTYYAAVGSSTGGNWYGAPRSVMVSLRGSW